MIFGFSRRSYQRELMDDLNLSSPELLINLDEIDKINAWLGGNKVTLEALDELLKYAGQPKEFSVVDMGCGSGSMLRIISDWAKNKGLVIKGLGVDANPFIAEYARQKSQSYPNLRFQALNVFSPAFEEIEADIFLASLFLHHFTETEGVRLLQIVKRNTKLGMIINDLHRNFLAYYGIALITGLFSRSYLTRHDSKVSVSRGFTKNELIKILSESGWQSHKVRWVWAFRWQVIAYQTLSIKK